MTYTTNINLKNLIDELKKKSSVDSIPVWKRIAVDLEKPSRNRRAVNISKISRYSQKDDVVVVPGKVLGTGELAHGLTVAAFTFSDSAKEKINKVGKAISLYDLMKENPKGKKVKIIG
jgi:large subunit ribosomal protein L18e